MSETSRRPIRPAAPATIRLAIVPLRIRGAGAARAISIRGTNPVIWPGSLGACGRRRSRRGGRGWSCGVALLAVLGGPVFFAEAAPHALFAALFESAGSVARLGHLTVA